MLQERMFGMMQDNTLDLSVTKVNIVVKVRNFTGQVNPTGLACMYSLLLWQYLSIDNEMI